MNQQRRAMRSLAFFLILGFACGVKAELVIEHEPNDTPSTANSTRGSDNLDVDASYDGNPDNFSFLVAKLAPNANDFDGWVEITLTVSVPGTVVCFSVFEPSGYAAIGGCALSPVVLDLYPTVQGGQGVYDVELENAQLLGPYHVSIVAKANPGAQPPTVVGTAARLLVPDGTSLQQVFGSYPETRSFVMMLEPGKTYAVETVDVDGDLTSNAIGTLGAFAGVPSIMSNTNVDCAAGNGPRPPAVDVNSNGLRCVIRTALPIQNPQGKWPVYIVATRMDPAIGGGSRFRIRAREATLYSRWLTVGHDYHVELENTTGDPVCVEVERYPAAGLVWSPISGWSGSSAGLALTVPAFGAVKQVIPSGSLVGTDGEGTLRINACASPSNLLPSSVHVNTYAVDPVANKFMHFFPSTANEGRTRSTW